MRLGFAIASSPRTRRSWWSTRCWRWATATSSASASSACSRCEAAASRWSSPRTTSTRCAASAIAALVAAARAGGRPRPGRRGARTATRSTCAGAAPPRLGAARDGRHGRGRDPRRPPHGRRGCRAPRVRGPARRCAWRWSSRRASPLDSPVMGVALFRDDGVYCYGPNTLFDGQLGGRYDGRYVLTADVRGACRCWAARYQASVSFYDRDHVYAYAWHHRLYPFSVRSERRITASSGCATASTCAGVGRQPMTHGAERRTCCRRSWSSRAQEGALEGDGLAAFVEALRARADLVLAERFERLEDRVRALEAENRLEARDDWRAEGVAALERTPERWAGRARRSRTTWQGRSARSARARRGAGSERRPRPGPMHADRLAGERQLATRGARAACSPTSASSSGRWRRSSSRSRRSRRCSVRQARRRLLPLAELLRGEARDQRHRPDARRRRAAGALPAERRRARSRRAARRGKCWSWTTAAGAVGGRPRGAACCPLAPARGYGPAVNAGAAVAAGELAAGAQRRRAPRAETAVARLREALAPEGVFAVVPRIVSPLSRCGDEGGKSATLRAGLVEIEEAPSSETHPTLLPGRLLLPLPRRRFLELGGYDDVYAPFFWEDVDLGYRAWRRGLASLHVPSAVCHHEGSATIGERPMDERLQAWHRNWALFHLRNLREPTAAGRQPGCLGRLRAVRRAPPGSRGVWPKRWAATAPRPPRPTGGRSDEEILAGVRQG